MDGGGVGETEWKKEEEVLLSSRLYSATVHRPDRPASSSVLHRWTLNTFPSRSLVCLQLDPSSDTNHVHSTVQASILSQHNIPPARSG